MEPKIGTLATCKACGQAIEYIGPYWRHVGYEQPRHIAQPDTTSTLVCGGCGRRVGALFNGLCVSCVFLDT